MLVKRWIARDSGATPPTSVSERSCSSPPTRARAGLGQLAGLAGLPLVSGSTTRNSVVAAGAGEVHPDEAWRAHLTACSFDCSALAYSPTARGGSLSPMDEHADGGPR